MSLLAEPEKSKNVQLPLRSNVEFSAGFAQFSLEKFSKSKAIAIVANHQKIVVGFYASDLDKTLLLEYSLGDLEQPTSVFLTGDEVTDFAYSKTAVFGGQVAFNCRV
jgi:hypothetical protein